jgi:hypothetical protein
VAVRFVVATLVCLTWAAGATQNPVDPLVSIRYGRDGSLPALNQLAAIKAVGFDAVAWPAGRPAELPEVRRQASIVGLSVVVLAPPTHLTARGARRPGKHVDVAVGQADPRTTVPLVWRAVAHGARSIAFDPGRETVSAADGGAAAWVAPAVGISRQLSANRRLVDALTPGPALRIDSARGGDLDVVLLDGGRAWVIVATNLSASRASARVTFPKGVPSGLWASWLDDSAMSMLYQPTGPVWSVELDGWGVKVYFVDKTGENLELRT